MFIKRDNKKDAIVAGYVVGDMKEKEFDTKKFYEFGISMGKDAGIINVTIWGRKPAEIKKGDHVLACGEFKVTKKDDKTYYSLTADFIIKENSTKIVEDLQPELTEIEEDGSLPF